MTDTHICPVPLQGCQLVWTHMHVCKNAVGEYPQSWSEQANLIIMWIFSNANELYNFHAVGVKNRES